MNESSANRHTLSLKNDYIFKAVYGNDNDESKYILKSLLNKILNREKDPITQIEYKNPFQPKLYIDDKETILDIKAITSHNELIDIEMQIVWDKYMPYRLIFYHGGLLREALDAGEQYKDIKNTITICITNSIAFKNSDQYMNDFYFMENDEHFQLTDRTRICCIELPKVNPDNRPLHELSPLEICLEYLRCAGDDTSEYVQELIHRGGKELEMAQNKLKKFTEDEIMRERALAREKYLHDQANLRLGFEELACGKQELERSKQELDRDRQELECSKQELECGKQELEHDRQELECGKQELECGKQELERDRQEIVQKSEEIKAFYSTLINNLRSNDFTDTQIADLTNLSFEKVKDIH